MARKRHLSRVAVMQVLFECERRDGDADACLQRNIGQLEKESGEVDTVFAAQLLEGILQTKDELQQTIQKDAPDWSLERMDPIARVVLLVGAYELLVGKDAPPAVVMNEAIDMAKEFGTAESGKFVNGVLNAIAKQSAA